MDAHRQLRHITANTIKTLTCEGITMGLDIDQSSLIILCDSCTYAKMTCSPLPEERTRKCTNKFGGEVHTDMWGPSPVKFLGSKLYYISFTDNKTRYTKLALLSQKSGAFNAYLDFEAWACTQHNTKILKLWSDRGSEYLSRALNYYLAKQGTER